MNKKPIKNSEARIIVYLSVVHNTRKYVTAIANKLEIDYSYLMRQLQCMTAKGWLLKHQFRRHMFYDLTPAAPVELAYKSLADESLQLDLKANYVSEEKPLKVDKVSMSSSEGEVVESPPSFNPPF